MQLPQWPASHHMSGFQPGRGGDHYGGGVHSDEARRVWGLRPWSHVDSHVHGSAERGADPVVGASAIHAAGPQLLLPAPTPNLAARRALGPHACPHPSQGWTGPSSQAGWAEVCTPMSMQINLQTDAFSHCPLSLK